MADPQQKEMLAQANQRVKEELTYRSQLLELVKEQADDPALWVEPVTAPEAYFQRAIRILHAAIEGDMQTLQLLRD